MYDYIWNHCQSHFSCLSGPIDICLNMANTQIQYLLKGPHNYQNIDSLFHNALLRLTLKTHLLSLIVHHKLHHPVNSHGWYKHQQICSYLARPCPHHTPPQSAPVHPPQGRWHVVLGGFSYFMLERGLKLLLYFSGGLVL